MKIEISENGWLFIDRAGRTSPQICPRRDDGGTHFCGDYCPLFGEPEAYRKCRVPPGTECPEGDCDECPHNSPAGIRLTICEDRVLYGEITDKRAPTPPAPPAGG